MTTYAGEVRIKTKLDAKGINEGMKKVSSSLMKAGAVAAQASAIALVGITALLTSMTLVFRKVMKMDGFKEKFSEVNLALKNLQNAALSALMPLVDALLPTLMRIVDWLTRAANAAAAFFAILTGASTYSVYVSDEYADNMERAEKAAKGSVASFDKLNVLNKQEESGGGGGGGGLPGEWVEKEIDFPWLDELKDKLFVIEVIAKAIGAAFLTWGISKLLGLDLVTTLGLMIFVAGAVGLVYGAFDALENGVDWDNLALMVGGVVLIFGGLFIAFGLTVAAIGLLVGGIAMLVVGIMDWVKKGELSTQTFWLLEAAIIAVGGALALLLGWPALVVAALVGVALAIYKYWDEIKAWLVKTWNTIKKNATENMIEPIKKSFKEVWENIKTWASETVEKIKTIWENTKTWFSEHVTEPVKELFDNLSKKLKEFMEHPFESLGEFVRGVFNGIIDFLNGLLSGLMGGINWIIEKLNSIRFTIPDWVPGIGGNSYGVNIPLASGLQIPYLATGAVIPPNAPFAAILGDQSSGRNLEAPEGLIRQIIREELGAMRAFNTEDRLIHNQIVIDGQVLYDAVKKVERRVGTSLLTRSAA